MKKNTKKVFANSENFNDLQELRNEIEDRFDVQSVKWSGEWNGLNWERFSFFCDEKTLESIKLFCKETHLGVTFN